MISFRIPTLNLYSSLCTCSATVQQHQSGLQLYVQWSIMIININNPHILVVGYCTDATPVKLQSHICILYSTCKGAQWYYIHIAQLRQRIDITPSDYNFDKKSKKNYLLAYIRLTLTCFTCNRELSRGTVAGRCYTFIQCLTFKNTRSI